MAQLKIPRFANTQRELIYSDFSSGLNYKDNPSLIKPSQSPEMQNVRIRDGTVGKRPGYKRLYPTSLGTGQVNGIGIYRKANGTTYRLICHSTNIYTQSGSSQPVLLKSGIANARSAFFTLNDNFFILNGVNFLVYDGSTCADVVGYIPTVLVGRSPSGAPNAGTINEKFNLLSAGFKISFSADGTSTTYALPYTSLDATTMVAVVNGVNKAETTDFTVNRTTGVVTFNVAPTTGTNNVIITAYKASLTHPEYIKNCTIATVYGGKTSATVFFSGNPNFPDQVWHSRLYGSNYSADYWPDDAWQKVPGNVAGLAHIFDLLYISHSKGHGYFSYVDGTSYPIFPYADINLEKGSDIPGSIQEVDNTVVCASSVNGVLQVLSNTTVNNRLSVNDVSVLINKAGVERQDLGLLRQANLQNAVSYNFDNYYGLCVNNVCYVWDYKSNAWLYDTNIPASCFATIDNTLCFGSNTDGLVYQFDPLTMNDDGVAINSWYTTREENAGSPTRIKVVNRLDLIAKPMNRSSVNILFLSRQSNGDITLQLQTNAFCFVNFNFSNFTFNTSFFPVLKRKRVSKRANYFQFKFSNNNLNEGMSVISLGVQFDQGSEMR
ncbi:MAG: hypothetical protein Q8911_00060 [Bacillota bacterium]|nr:hypothetical protein [Bacillota bacterium]